MLTFHVILCAKSNIMLQYAHIFRIKIVQNRHINYLRAMLNEENIVSVTSVSVCLSVRRSVCLSFLFCSSAGFVYMVG